MPAASRTGIRGWATVALLGLRSRIFLLLGLLVFINLAGPAIMLWYGQSAGRLYADIVERDMAALGAARGLEEALVEERAALAAVATGGGAEAASRARRFGESFKRRLAEAGMIAARTGDEALLTDMAFAHDRYVAEQEALLSLSPSEGSPSSPPAVGRFNESERLYHLVKEKCEAFRAAVRERMEQSGAAYKARTEMVIALAWTAIPVDAALGFILGYILLRQVFDPIRRLARLGPGEHLEDEFSDEVKALSQRFRTLLEDVDQAHLDLEESRGHLIQSEKLALAGKLAAGVAHTIRNPLTSVKMRLFSLERTLKLDPAQAEDFEVISQEIGHIDTIVRNFLEFSRPPKLIPQSVSLSDVVDTTLTLLKHRLESYGVQVVLQRGKRLTPIQADPDQLKEVLVNLVLNACEAMGEGGRITIREEDGFIEPMGRVVVARVSDSGPGVPASLREKVFQPFFTTKGEGSGLGLAIARRVVEEHGGWINLHSPEGRGATFTIMFPNDREVPWHRY